MINDPGDEDFDTGEENEPTEDLSPYELPFHFGGDPIEGD